MYINKDSFIMLIDLIETMMKTDEARSENISIAFPNAHQANLLIDGTNIDQLIKIIEVISCDDNDGWVSYFCFDLDFGKNNDKLKAFDSDKNEIPLKTAEDLYSLLQNKLDNKMKLLSDYEKEVLNKLGDLKKSIGELN